MAIIAMNGPQVKELVLTVLRECRRTGFTSALQVLRESAAIVLPNLGGQSRDHSFDRARWAFSRGLSSKHSPFCLMGIGFQERQGERFSPAVYGLK
jgi:hypothetical protein